MSFLTIINSLIYLVQNRKKRIRKMKYLTRFTLRTKNDPIDEVVFSVAWPGILEGVALSNTWLSISTLLKTTLLSRNTSPRY